MAPRTVKAKKTDTKIAENEVPKKGRGKTKTVEEPDVDAQETEVGDVPVVEKKTKRGKKVEAETNGQEKTNGVSEDKAPPAKKGRKKKTDTPEENNGVDADEDKTSQPDNEKTSQPDNETEVQSESNGQAEKVPASGGKGKKKPASKPKPEPKSSRGKKNSKQETESEDKEEASEDLVKPAAKGRGRKAPQKTNKEAGTEEKNESNESVKESPKKEVRKRGPMKPSKENTPENEQTEEDLEAKPAEEHKKKEPKGKKNNVKKAAKAEDEDEETKPEPASKKRKVAKKDGKDDVKDEEAAEETAVEPKSAKSKRGPKKESPAEAEEAGDTNKRRRKAADEKVSSEDKKSKAPLKNKSSTNYDEIDFSNSSKTVQGKEWNLKISSWNVDGIRAWMNKGGLDYIKYEKPDILCLQETKCAKDKLPDEIANLPGYHAYWVGSDTEGYAGVGIYTTKLAISVQYGLGNEELDADGRMITAEYEQFYLICTYVPNAGRKLVTLPKRLQWNEEFRKYVKALNEKKPVIICGDMNVAHNEIDLSNPKANKKNAGFTPEERAGMTELLADGFIDSYRHLRPDDTGAYTFWTYMSNARAKNVGWRLDYFLLSERLLPTLCDNVIRSEVYGSDHCPITLFLHMTSANKPKE